MLRLAKARTSSIPATVYPIVERVIGSVAGPKQPILLYKSLFFRIFNII
jgi:hypothetical protein